MDKEFIFTRNGLCNMKIIIFAANENEAKKYSKVQ